MQKRLVKIQRAQVVSFKRAPTGLALELRVAPAKHAHAFPIRQQLDSRQVLQAADLRKCDGMEGADCEALCLTLPAQLQCSQLEFCGCIAGKGDGAESAGFVFREKSGCAHGKYAGLARSWTSQNRAMPLGRDGARLVLVEFDQATTALSG